MADFLLPKHHHNRTTTTTTTGLETAAWAARILFLFIGVASTAVLTARFAFPYFLSLFSFSSHLPTQLWTAPPYLFITVHFIIMVIWKLHGHQRPEEDQDLPGVLPLPPDLDTRPAELPTEKDPQESEPNSCDVVHTVIRTTSSEIIVASAFDNETKSDAQQQQLPRPPLETEIKEEMNYAASSGPDSIDATWQAIMEGKSSPVKNPLKKSDTWEKTSKPTPVNILARGGAAAVVGTREFKKSDTFREAKTASKDEEIRKEMRKCKTVRESTGWRRRDVLVVGHDELFSKVEAFIKMNYDQMRLQRKESEQKKQHYAEMVSAAY